jgi:hypothetical protein
MENEPVLSVVNGFEKELNLMLNAERFRYGAYAKAFVMFITYGLSDII